MSYGNTDETSHTERSDGVPEAIESAAGMSPYATGGGGVTFERKVAVKYLAHLLVGDGAVEFGNGRRAVTVAFQQAPDHPVDDLVVSAARPGELDLSSELALEVRRSPNLVASDESTQGLIRKFIRAVINAPTDGIERRLGLVVAGPQQHAEQLGKLADLAAAQMDAPGFVNLVRTPSKFDAGIRGRLDQLERLVERSLQDLGVAGPQTALVQQRTWQLLSSLVVLMPRLESPDEIDWSTVANSLIGVSRTSDLAGASQLRDRLVVLASEYPPKSARVDLKLLRRDAHGTLDPRARRHQEGWQALDHLHHWALQSVRDEIATIDDTHRVSLDRSDAAKALVATARKAAAVIVSGESGVGKSALALLSLTAAGAADPDTVQALCINLRQVPKLTVEFETILGCPLSTLLCELGAPHRMLIVDGADAVAEGREDAFRYLVDAANRSDVKVIAVTAVDSMQVVRDTLTDRFGARVAEYAVHPLTDTEIHDIVATFTELGKLNTNPRSRELLRRLVLIDLLVRGRLRGVPLTDADAMREVWSGLVRRHERSERGSPDARELVLLRLADLALSGGDRLSVVGELDATAVQGLRHDGLLRTSIEAPFMIGPEFAHDEVRRYAVARLLLADGEPTSRIRKYAAPRWAVGAARLACQEWLAEPDSAACPLKGRFAGLQASFDALVEAGYGARWGDVPSEALVTLTDPTAILRDAWPELRAGDADGLRRLARLVDQRLRKDNGIVDLIAVEPIITLLLEDSAPWRSGKYASDLLREWLNGHAFAGTPAGHPSRILLRERLVAASAAADRRLAQQREAAMAARAARTPKEIERERQREESNRALFSTIGYGGGGRRRQRPEVPREFKDEIFLELLALLGRDLGDDGEAILRRVAQAAPWSLAPAVEEPFTGPALANYRRGLLAELTEAYYLDDEADGADVLDDGVRDHHARGASLFSPPSAWCRGPFMALFQSDFLGGVAALNRLLNHAALIGAPTLARLDQRRHSLEDIDVAPYQADLEVTGTSKVYVGDGHVWMWYRGTGVGPYPCMSALQALERVCDQLFKAGIPLRTLVSILLDGCENLAMVGLVVGLLVRHLEAADNLLDPFLTDPFIWRCEFSRVASEHSGLAASSEGIVAPQRRNWSLREVAMSMVVGANDERATELRALGETLIEKAHRLIELAHTDEATEEGADNGEYIEEQLAPVRAWASTLDRDRYQAHEAPDGLYIRATPPEDVVQALKPGNEDLERVQEETRLIVRYYVEPRKDCVEATGSDELTADIACACDLLKNPPSLSANHPWDAPALVAAAALEAFLLRRVDVPHDSLAFAADTILRISEGEASPRPHEFEGGLFEQGADRSAARALPLLLLPIAAPLRTFIDGADGWTTFERAAGAGLNLARAVANEVRLHLARGLDHLWTAPCAEGGRCHHEIGLQLASEMMRDCAVSGWIADAGVRRVNLVEEPLAQSLTNVADDSILPSRLDASIRALAPAATANICVSTSARELLTVLFAAQRRSLLNQKQDPVDQRGTHTLVSARALLTLAQHDDDTAIYEYISAYADNPALLGNLLRALSAAAEETPDRADEARRIWPSVMRYVLELHKSGRVPLQGDYYGKLALAALLPNAAHETTYRYQEIQGDQIIWWEPTGLRPEVEAWLTTAAGSSTCVDQLIGFLSVLTPEDQARIGLPWVATLVLADPARIANRTFMLTTWLIEMRSATADVCLLAKWQQSVDTLVIEGVTQLAPYSE